MYLGRSKHLSFEVFLKHRINTKLELGRLVLVLLCNLFSDLEDLTEHISGLVFSPVKLK